MRRGFEQIGARCVFTSEWDEKAQESYRANFGHEHISGDIRQVDAGEIPEHDVLLAGFPCQPFSLAGISKKNSLGRAHGFECKTQGTLFFEIKRILDTHRPKAFLLENVKNLRGHNKGQTFAVIEQVLTEELGYQVQTRVIDACSFVPQHRERLFIVGFRDENDFDFEALNLPDPAEGPRLSSILHSQARDDPAEPPYTLGSKARVNPKYTLTENLWKYLQAYKAKHQAAGNGFGYGLVTGKDVSRTLSARYYKDGAEILIKRRADPPRRLTPRECARLMGFDCPGEPHWRIPVSDTQAYRQFGNAVVPQVVAAVAQQMAAHLKPEAGISDRITISDLRVKGAGAALNS